MASRTNLLVEFCSDSTVNLVQVLVCQPYLSDRSVWVEESVIHNPCSCSSGETSLLARLSFGLSHHFPLVKEVVEFSHLFDKGFIIDDVALTIIDRLLVCIIQRLVLAWSPLPYLRVHS